MLQSMGLQRFKHNLQTEQQAPWDIVSLVPDHGNKATIETKQAM